MNIWAAARIIRPRIWSFRQFARYIRRSVWEPYTVNLTLLASEGEILKLNCGDGVEHYDAQTAPHCHYYCRSCGSLKDIFMEEPIRLAYEKESEDGDFIEGCNIMFYGICEKCKNAVDKAE